MKTSRIPGGARRSRPVFAALPMLVASAAFAASESGHREHGAHEHGHGTLDVAVEGEDLVIEFRIPAVNAVGFEHAPSSDAEREAVRQALARFGDAVAVLVPSPDAECEPERAEAGFSGMDHGGSGEDRERHEEDGHAHGEDGDTRDKDEDERHGHDHDHDEHQDGGPESGEPDADSGAEAHSELHAAYHFHCHAPERLDRIRVRVFELLHDAEEIEVRVVTPALQKAVDLHPGDTVVELSP